MTFNNEKPDPGKSPSLDVSTIQGNFSSFGTVFSNTSGGVILNHIAMNDVNQGNHSVMLFDTQTQDPGVTTSLATVYSKNVTSATGGSKPQLFVQIPKFLPTKFDTTPATNIGMQLTCGSVNTAGAVFQSFLPGGYLMYFGSISNVAVPVTVSPTPTKIVAAFATANNVDGSGSPFSVSVQVLSATQFKINSNATGAYTFTWMAIAIQ